MPLFDLRKICTVCVMYYPPTRELLEQKRNKEIDARDTERLELDRRRDQREQRLYWLTVISVGVSVVSLFIAGVSMYAAVTALRLASLQ